MARSSNVGGEEMEALRRDMDAMTVGVQEVVSSEVERARKEERERASAESESVVKRCEEEIQRLRAALEAAEAERNGGGEAKTNDAVAEELAALRESNELFQQAMAILEADRERKIVS